MFAEVAVGAAALAETVFLLGLKYLGDDKFLIAPEKSGRQARLAPLCALQITTALNRFDKLADEFLGYFLEDLFDLAVFQMEIECLGLFTLHCGKISTSKYGCNRTD